MMWLPRKINLADPDAKPDSQLIQTLQLLFKSGCLPIDFNESATQHSNLSTG